MSNDRRFHLVPDPEEPAAMSARVTYGRCEHTDGRGRCSKDGQVLVADFNRKSTACQWFCWKHSGFSAHRGAA